MQIEYFQNKNLAVYGAGSCFHWYYEIFYIKHDIAPQVVIDKKFSKEDCYEGFFATNDIQNLSNHVIEELSVLVAVGDKATYESIADYLLKIGVKEVFFLHEIYEIHNPFDKSLTSFYTNHQKNSENISRLRELLSDQLSKDIFDNVLSTHLTQKPIILKKSPSDEQYFPVDLCRTLNHSRSIFCGADNHDIVKLSQKFREDLEWLIVCEPDPWVFEDLSKCAVAQTGVAKIFQLLQLAVSNENGRKPFASANSKIGKRKHVTGYGSRLSSKGNELVISMKLDEIFVTGAPTFIGMDIEGEELNALVGGVNVLKRGVPDLAISVYHDPEHIWQVIAYLTENVPSYRRFYLRNYTGYCAETVLYAIG